MASLALWIVGAVSTVLVAWAIRFGYALVVGDSDKQLRSFLLTTRSRWKRERYIRAFVAAVRGRTVMGDAFVAVNTMTAAVAAFWMAQATIGVIAMIESGNTESRQREQIYRVEALLSKLDEPLKKPDADDPRSELKELRQGLKETEPNIRRMKRFAQLMFLVPSGLAVTVLLVAFFWGPIFVKKRIFAFEVERFTLRMQGLATAEELAELALLETRVSDEASLREFIHLTRRIAVKHSVPQLAARFDLWSGEESARSQG